MKTKFFLGLFIAVFSASCFAQEYGWVEFTDKKGSSFDPFTYFDAKAIERRVINDYDLYDSSDFPLNESYISVVSSMCDSMMGYSRWFNMIFIKAGDDEISKIKELSFVKGFTPYEMQTVPASVAMSDTLSDDLQLQKNQVGILGGPEFGAAGFNGKGIRIAVLDGGFPSVDKHPAFKHIRDENRILKTWDFTSDKEYVYSFQSHGTSVLSCIAGINEGMPMGLATEAEFLLARTEVVPEPFSEEKNWMMAAEWADKNGAQIINSSLGYTKDRYFPHQMDGKYTYVSRAANMAARKGILVINAAGNEGDKKNWKIIGAPADADSVLSIGGIDPDTYYHISFSSFGPTADKRVKPNVCAFGKVLAAAKSGTETTFGTSFAAPLATGFAACAMQTRPGIKNMELYNEIEKSATLYPYFDYAHGYGIPQAEYFLKKEAVNKKEAALLVEINDTGLKIKVTEIYPETEKKKNYLYYHFQNEKGFIERYGVVDVYQNDAFEIYDVSFYDGCTFRAHYHGSTVEIPVKQTNN